MTRFAREQEAFLRGSILHVHSTAIKGTFSSYDGDIRAENKKSGVMSLLVTATRLMYYVKGKYFVAENESSSGVKLSSAARNAYEKLQFSIEPGQMVYQALFKLLLEVV